MSGMDVKTQGMTPVFDYQAGVVQDSRLRRWGAEMEYLNGPVSLKAEYLSGTLDSLSRAGAPADLALRGYYIALGVVLTGEKAVQNAVIRPRKNFDPPGGGAGAIQLVIRYQAIEMNDDPVEAGLVIGPRKARSITAGINWYPNPHVRFLVDYDRAWFDEEIVSGGFALKNENIVIARMLFDF